MNGLLPENCSTLDSCMWTPDCRFYVRAHSNICCVMNFFGTHGVAALMLVTCSSMLLTYRSTCPFCWCSCGADSLLCIPVLVRLSSNGAAWYADSESVWRVLIVWPCLWYSFLTLSVYAASSLLPSVLCPKITVQDPDRASMNRWTLSKLAPYVLNETVPHSVPQKVTL